MSMAGGDPEPRVTGSRAALAALAVLLLPLGADARQPASHGDTVPIRSAVLDVDGDFRPDRLGDTVTVSGVATMGSGVLNPNQLRIFLQDSTGAVQLHAPAIWQEVDAGDRVSARGVVGQYRGQTQLEVLEYRASASSAGVPSPERLTGPDSAALELHEGRLVRLTGTVVGSGTNEGGRFLWVFPDGGTNRVQVFVADWRSRPIELAGFATGERIEVTGVLGQYDYRAPYTSWYQLHPRSPEDLRRPDRILGMNGDQAAMAGGGILLLGILGLGLWGSRMHRERTEFRERNDILFEKNQAGVFRATVDGKILDCNPALAEMYGYESPEELTDVPAWELYPNLSDREDYLEALREEEELEDYLHHHQTRDGEELWVLENARLIETDSDDRQIVGTAVNLTDRVRAEQREEAAEKRYRALFEQNVAGAFRSKPGGELLEVNPAFAEMLGYDSPEQLVGTDARELYTTPEDRDELMDRLHEEGSLRNQELALTSRDGDTVWVLENSFVAEDPATGELVNIGTVTEITEHVREERQLEELAHRDPLTGVPNRRYLEETVPRMLARSRREGAALGLIYIDLNDFKEINDRWGHGAGDAVLQKVATRLNGAVRESDLLGRVGGDEFVVILPGLDGPSAAARAAHRQAEEAFREPVEAEGEVFPVSASQGVAVFPEHGTDFDELLTRADRAMYRASRNGKLVELYDDALDQPYVGRLRRHLEIREGLENDEIVGYVQPIYRLDDGRLDGVELLVRWRQEDGDVMGAEKLISVARTADLLPDLDREMLRQGSSFAEEWESGTVAVNLSQPFLQSSRALDAVREILDQYPSAVEHLTVEVTEHTAMAEPEVTQDLLREISDMGIRLALDDFGTGYSSLSVLESLHVDEIKLDQSLIHGIGRGGRSEDLLLGVLDLARSVSATAVAEGVEREEQLHWLRENGCDRVQGYLMGHPVPPGETLARSLEEACGVAGRG